MLRKKILLVDDSATILMMEKMILTKGPYHTITASNGEEAVAKVPIIMVTTRGEEHNVETGYQAGCTDYITKPINGSELMVKLRNYLGQ